MISEFLHVLHMYKVSFKMIALSAENVLKQF